MINIPRAQPLRWQLARIGATVRVRNLIAPTVRQWKGRIASADACQIARKIGELAGHEVDYLALTLDAAPYPIMLAPITTCVSASNIDPRIASPEDVTFA